MTIDTSREAVERILENVTPGPWKELSGANHHIMASYMCINGLSAMFALARIDNPDDAERGYTDDAYNPDTARANARFIAAARELVPALLARAEAAEAERDAALAEVARLSTARAALATPAHDAVQEIVAEAVKAEREACARVCETLGALGGVTPNPRAEWKTHADNLAAAIRARGEG